MAPAAIINKNMNNLYSFTLTISLYSQRFNMASMLTIWTNVNKCKVDFL